MCKGFQLYSCMGINDKNLRPRMRNSEIETRRSSATIQVQISRVGSDDADKLNRKEQRPND